jgi:hypothetical protein
VAKDEWGDDWNELSAIQIKSNPDAGYDFYYNKDNRDLLYSQGLGKLVAKAHLEARRKLARSELNQMEDNYIARLNRHSGTENA